MKGQGYRHGYLAAGVLTASVIALGWTTQWAPARDAITPKVEKQWLSEEQQVEQAQAVMEQIRAEGLPVIVRENLERPRALIHAPKDNDGSITTENGRRARRDNRAEVDIVAGAGAFATGGGVGPGGACTCDSQCMAAAGQCRVAHCVGGICVQSLAQVDTVCNFPAEAPALFCTEDRCDSAGVCQDTRAQIGGAERISPCSKQCCATTACALGSFQNCFEASDCPGVEGCFKKRQLDGGTTYVADCDEALDQCFVETLTANNVPVGRCCSAGGVCTKTTQAACVGNWWRWRDPDDSQHACGATLGCPKYSSGIAPVDLPASQIAVGPIVPFARRCSIGGGVCEVNADCIDRCNGGIRLNESCDNGDPDCPIMGGGFAVCQPGGVLDLCLASANECQTGAPAVMPPPVGPFTSIGDDYRLSNDSYLRLSEFRFRGGVREPDERVLFEFYDSSFNPPRLVNFFQRRFDNAGDADYRFIVDCSPNCDLTQLPESFGQEEPADPPFIIPPQGFVVMRATRLGAVDSPVDVEFGEDDANLFWYTSISAPDVGGGGGPNFGNNPNVMWVNGVIGNYAGLASDIMAFELLGEKLTSPPLGACCNPDTGVCVDTLEWDCMFCTNPARTPCERDRDCGLNGNVSCTSQDWKGGKTRAQVNNNAHRVCGQSYCFNPLNPNPATVVPCNPGPCPGGQTCETPCQTATCCVAAGINAGCNEVVSDAACVLLGGVTGTVVFGQKCTPDCCPVLTDPPTGTGVDCCKDYLTCHTGAGPFVDTGATCNYRCFAPALTQTCTEDFECPPGVGCDETLNMQADCPNGQTCRIRCDGPDGVGDPRIHAVNVPTFNLGTEQIVIDFEGVTAGANYFDDCALGGADFGWYEIFAFGVPGTDLADTCAEVTLNFCCSNPEITPVTVAIDKGCPCAGSETIFADENSLGQQFGFGAACNNSFCCTDNNFSVQWTMPAGTYTYGIVADKNCSNPAGGDSCFNDSECDPGTWCRRNNAAYKGHIIFKPCPPGACCGQPGGGVEPFCSVTDKFTCRDSRKWCKSNQMACDDASDCPSGDSCLAGVFLGDKEVGPINECDGDPCSLGACCIGPGNCQDMSGMGVSFATCAASQGTYIGGFLCAENPCPVCPIETQDQCQTATTGQFILPSDRIIGVRRADDFRPAGLTIRRICWFPCFIGVTADTQGFECSDPGTEPPDMYIAKFYADSLGRPGAPIGLPGGYNLVVDAKLNSDPGGGSRCWRYTAPITPNLTVTPGACMWIEVVGLGEQQAQGLCLVHALSSADGNNYSMRDVNNSYQLSDFDKNDLAFCIDSGIMGATSPPLSQDGGCGNFNVACCRPGPVCLDGGTYTQCVGTNQAPVVGFPFPFIDCNTLAGMGGCPIPDNDLCAAAEMPAPCMNQVSNPNLGVCSVSEGPPNVMEVCDMTVNPGLPAKDCAGVGAICGPLPANTEGFRCQFPTDNRLATTDGPNTQGGAAGTLSCFPSGVNSFQADTWYKYTSPCTGDMTIHSCGPNKTYDSMLQVYNNPLDPTACVPCTPTNNTLSQGCSDDNCGTNSSGSELRIPVAEGGCYLIRYGGWSQLGSPADASQNVSGLDLGVVCDPVVAAATPLVAPSPHNRRKNRYISFNPNNPTGSVAFRVARTTAPTGSCWVQAPILTPGADQFTATCGALPVFRTWAEAVIHVGDCEIIPVVDYTIFANSPGPIENPVGLAVPTILVPNINGKLWADSVGSFNGTEWTPPNQIGNVNDVLAILARIAAAAGAPQFVVANLGSTSSADSCLTAQVNTADTLAAVQAVSGNSYGPPSSGRFTTFAQCAVAPSGTCLCCGN